MALSPSRSVCRPLVLLWALLSCAWAGAAPVSTPAPGAMVASVGPGPATVAGFKVGDRITSWQLRPTGTVPPGLEDHGDIRDPWDILALEIGAALIGDVQLRGQRAGKAQRWVLASGSWTWTLAAALSPQAAATDAQAVCAAAEQTAKDPSVTPRAGAWGYWRCAQLLRQKGDHSGAQGAFASTLERLQGSGEVDAIAAAQLAWVQLARRVALPVAEVAPLLDAAALALPDAAAQGGVPLLLLDLEKARNLFRASRFQEALAAAQTLNDQVQARASGTLLESLTLQVLGQCLRDTQQYPQAVAMFERALRFHQGRAATLESAGSAVVSGNTQRALGNGASAEALMKAALHDYQILDPGGRQLASSWYNLGSLYIDRGELVQAEDALQRALKLQLQIDPSGNLSRTSYIALAALALERGELAQAREHVTRAIEILTRVAPNSDELASAHAQSGLIAAGAGDRSEALAAYARAESIWREIAPGSMRHSWAVQARAEILLQQGERETAKADLRTALEMRRKLAPEGLDVAKVEHVLADVAIDDGELDSAAANLDHALPIMARMVPDSSLRAHAINSAGRLARQRGDAAAARELLCEAVEVIERQRNNISLAAERRARFAARQRRIYDDCIDARLQAGDSSAAFGVIERGRARGLLELMQDRAIVIDSAVDPSLRSQRDDLAAELARAQQGNAAEAEIDEIRTRQDELIARIRRESPRYAALRYPQPIALDEAIQALPPDTAVIIYALMQDHAWALVLRSGDLEAHAVRLDLGLDSAHTLTGDLIRAFGQGGQAPVVQSLLRSAHARLIAPMASLIGDRKRLIIVPDADLNLVPYAALIDQHSHYLIESSAISTVASLTLLRELQTRQAPSKALFAAADPLADGVALPELALRGGRAAPSALPYSRNEVREIARLYAGGSHTLLGTQATEAAVRERAHAAGVVHLAVHGYFDADSPINSALLLAPHHGAPALEDDDGVVRVFEVFDRWKLDADLVVLSACETGVGEVSSSEGLYGLTRAFQYAGARTVLSSLWAVPDRSTADLMVSFHRFRKSGLDGAQALRQAQLAMLRSSASAGAAAAVRGVGGLTVESTAPQFAAPLHWAGFVLHGAAD